MREWPSIEERESQEEVDTDEPFLFKGERITTVSSILSITVEEKQDDVLALSLSSSQLSSHYFLSSSHSYGELSLHDVSSQGIR